MKMQTLMGLCVSKGTAKGVVYIVPENKKIKSFSQDTILVMKSLEREILVNINDKIVGVIAEKGNIGSHGAGILRQMKIPCVLRVKNATSRLSEGELVELIGEKNCIICLQDPCEKNTTINEFELSFKYKDISKDNFGLIDIRPNNFWYKPRPDRVYQKLRFDIICDVYASSSQYLYNLPAKTRQDSNGVLEIFGTPNIADICSFVLKNPSWLKEKAYERTRDFVLIKREMENMMHYCNSNEVNSVTYVFKKSIELYRAIFKYLFLAQLTSDEFIDIYLDFIKYVTKKSVSRDIFNLKSDYVEKCLKSGIDPGGFETWNGVKQNPHIWYGEINYTPFAIDNEIKEAIEKFPCERDQLLKDYNAFREIIPLIYQLSEEFFYISKSINTFLNWSMIRIHELLTEIGENISIEQFYDTPLITIYDYINNLGGISSMNYEFMSAFHPEDTLVKEFKYWLILVRENQLTLGDCYFVLKREIPSFSDMREEEGAELSKAMKWYEDRCRILFGAEKFNYVAAMMRDNFVHFHAFPRYSKPISRYGFEWNDERWPGLVRFGPSVCEPEYYQKIKNELKE